MLKLNDIIDVEKLTFFFGKPNLLKRFKIRDITEL